MPGLSYSLQFFRRRGLVNRSLSCVVLRSGKHGLILAGQSPSASFFRFQGWLTPYRSVS